MTISETLKQLKALGSAKVRAQNAKTGAGDNQFGVSLGDIWGLAKKIGKDHALAVSLWDTGNSAVDDEQHAGGHWDPRAQTAQAVDRHRREAGNLSGLSRVEGLHVTVRPDLD